MKKYGIFVDTETTGLLAAELADIHHQPFITELYACKYDKETFEIVDEVNTLVSIPVPLSEEIIKITGITEEMLQGKPEFQDVIPDFIELCEEVDTIGGHNVMFDYDVIRHNFRRHEVLEHFPEFDYKICTVEMSYPIEKKRLKLSQLYFKATGKTHEGAHRAKADVLATFECYKWLLSEGF